MHKVDVVTDIMSFNELQYLCNSKNEREMITFRTFKTNQHMVLDVYPTDRLEEMQWSKNFDTERYFFRKVQRINATHFANYLEFYEPLE